MYIETLVLSVNESISYVLWYSIDRNRDTLEVALYSMDNCLFDFTVFIGLVAVEIGVASRFKLLESNVGGVVHKVDHVGSHSRTYDSTRNDYDQQQRQESSRDNSHKLFENEKSFTVFFLFLVRRSFACFIHSCTVLRRSVQVFIFHFVRMTVLKRRQLLSENLFYLVLRINIHFIL